MKQTITPETCVFKIQRMRSATSLDDQIDVCYSCSGMDLNCGKYIPISKTSIPIRQGYNAYLNGCGRIE